MVVTMHEIVCYGSVAKFVMRETWRILLRGKPRPLPPMNGCKAEAWEGWDNEPHWVDTA